MTNGLKKKIGALGMAIALGGIGEGCAFLQSKGILSPDDITAICADVVSACSIASQANADEQTKQACAILTAQCASQVPAAPATVPVPVL